MHESVTLVTICISDKNTVIDINLNFITLVMSWTCFLFGGSEAEALEYLKKLEVNEVDPRSIRKDGGWTLLHYAALNGWLEVVKKLMTEYKCSVSSKNCMGDTPLDVAYQYYNKEIVDFLTTVIIAGNNKYLTIIIIT